MPAPRGFPKTNNDRFLDLLLQLGELEEIAGFVDTALLSHAARAAHQRGVGSLEAARFAFAEAINALDGPMIVDSARAKGSNPATSPPITGEWTPPSPPSS